MISVMSLYTSHVKRVGVAAVAVGVLVLTGCSDDGGDISKADTSTETTAASGGGSETTAASDEQAGESDAPSETTAKDAGSKKKSSTPERNPSVDGFCDALSDVASEQAGAQDFGALQATAPDEIAPLVDKLAESAEEAQATEQPSVELQERAVRSVIGVTVYAIDECPDADGLIESIGLTGSDVKVLDEYSVKDVEDDAKWKKLWAELQQG